MKHPAAGHALAVLAVVAVLCSGCLPAEWGAGAILHPTRRPVLSVPDLPFRPVSIEGSGPRLAGWLFPAVGPRRGLIVYLHGSADNRSSSVGLAHRLTQEGWDVLAYDSRAHGESEGEACTYGYFEKADVSRALDAVGASEAVVFGVSLGAAVALQAAAVEARIRGVVALAPFADLRRILTERARRFPLPVGPEDLERAINLAQDRAGFRVDEVSPRRAARSIKVPVLLIHGLDDRDIDPSHSDDIDRALRTPHRLLRVRGAGHNDLLGHPEAWAEIEHFLAGLAGTSTVSPLPAVLP